MQRHGIDTVSHCVDVSSPQPFHSSLTQWLADEKKAGMYRIAAVEGHK
jgi:hypothetical protein